MTTYCYYCCAPVAPGAVKRYPVSCGKAPCPEQVLVRDLPKIEWAQIKPISYDTYTCPDCGYVVDARSQYLSDRIKCLSCYLTYKSA